MRLELLQGLLEVEDGQALFSLAELERRSPQSCHADDHTHILQRRAGGRSHEYHGPPTSSNLAIHEFSGQRRQIRFFSSCMLRPRPRISLVRTSKLAGVPASRVFSPLTIDS